MNINNNKIERDVRDFERDHRDMYYFGKFAKSAIKFICGAGALAGGIVSVVAGVDNLFSSSSDKNDRREERRNNRY